MWQNLMDMHLRKTLAVFSKCWFKNWWKKIFANVWQVYFQCNRCAVAAIELSLFVFSISDWERCIISSAIFAAARPQFCLHQLHFSASFNLISQQFLKSLIILKNISISSSVHAYCSMLWTVIAIKVFPLRFCKIYLFRITWNTCKLFLQYTGSFFPTIHTFICNFNSCNFRVNGKAPCETFRPPCPVTSIGKLVFPDPAALVSTFFTQTSCRETDSYGCKLFWSHLTFSATAHLTPAPWRWGSAWRFYDAANPVEGASENRMRPKPRGAACTEWGGLSKAEMGSMLETHGSF